jgi:hypothetical protein
MVMILYHGSPDTGIKVFTPRISTHGKPYVYATQNMDETILYGAKWNDFMITCCSDDVIVERYTGAIDALYKNRKGYIYILDVSTFHPIENNECGELVSEVPVDVIDRLIINNLYDVVTKKYNIYRYPNRPSFIPDDDCDIVMHTIKIFNMCLDKTIFPYVLNLFPHLVTIFDNELKRHNIAL